MGLLEAVGRKGRYTLEPTEEVIRALAAAGVYFLGKDTPRFLPGARLHFSDATRVERYVAYLSGLNICSMGAFSYSSSELHVKVQVGRYCSIAEDVADFRAHHPMDALSTSQAFHDHSRMFADAIAAAGGRAPDPVRVEKKALPRIGHDVWIGRGAILGFDITIGTGAVIAAGAVVTKDVEPYAVVAGVPARVIRKRFDDRTIERLLASRWWDYGFPQFAGMDVARPERFLDQFESAKARGELTPLPAPRPFIDVVREAIAPLEPASGLRLVSA